MTGLQDAPDTLRGLAADADAHTRVGAFVSYAREDIAFIRRLDGALRARGKSTWIDWKDIPPTADWRAKVRAGIDAAGAFVIVLSPSALGSEMCDEERVHAVDGNKRIVPLLLTDLGDREVPGELAARNWIMFRPGDDFDHAVDLLVDALETDLEWVDAHARLLVRAREWRLHHSERSYLLRGRDLRAAEDWLAREGRHRERAAPAQKAYIAASRLSARRTRFALISSALALGAVAATFGVVGLVQSNRATSQSRQSRSRALAAQAVAQLPVDPRAALRRAIQARVAADTPQAGDALRRALAAPRPLAILRVRKGSIQFARFAARSDDVITTGYNETVRRWNITRGTTTVLPGGLGQRTWGPPSDVSPDGQLRVEARASGDVRLEDAATHTVLEEATNLGVGLEGSEPSAQFSPDGRTFLTVGYDGTVRVWPVNIMKLADREVMAAAFDSTGRLTATADKRGIATLWNTQGARLHSWRYAPANAAPSPGDVHISFSAGGQMVYIQQEFSLSAWATATGVRLGDIDTSRFGAAYGNTGKLVVRDDRGQHSATIFGPGGKVVSRIKGLRYGIGAGVFSADDGRLVTYHRQEDVARVWDVATGRRLARIGPFSAPLDAFDISPHGDLVVTGGERSLRLWHARGGAPARALPGHTGFVVDARFSPDGRLVASASADGTARVWDVASGREIEERAGDPHTVIQAAVSRDDRLLSVGMSGAAIISACPSCGPSATVLEDARRAAARHVVVAVP
jgi:WD40 repeat protein